MSSSNSEDSKCKLLTAFEKIKRSLYEKHPGTEFAYRITEDSDTVGTSYLFHVVENVNSID